MVQTKQDVLNLHNIISVFARVHCIVFFQHPYNPMIEIHVDKCDIEAVKEWAYYNMPVFINCKHIGH